MKNSFLMVAGFFVVTLALGCSGTAQCTANCPADGSSEASAHDDGVDGRDTAVSLDVASDVGREAAADGSTEVGGDSAVVEAGGGDVVADITITDGTGSDATVGDDASTVDAAPGAD